MKNLILISFFLLSITFVNGQDNKFSFGLSGSIDDYNIDFNPTSKDRFETTLGYSFGLELQYNINKRWYLKSGAVYANKGYLQKFNFNFIAIDPNDPAIPKELIVSLQYLNIPLMVGFYLKNSGKIRLSISTGINNEIAINNSEKTRFQDGKAKDTESLPSPPTYLSSVQFNGTVEYHIGQKLFISFSPYFKYLFTDIENNFISFQKPMFGGFIGVSYKLSPPKQ